MHQHTVSEVRGDLGIDSAYCRKVEWWYEACSEEVHSMSERGSEWRRPAR